KLLSLSELIHEHIRVAIETAVREELRSTLGTTPYERSELRRDYRNGRKTRTLTGPTGPVALTLPRATLFADGKEWTSRIIRRYQRRIPEVNEAIVATYLAGSNTRRIRGALQPLLKTAPLSKRAVSRVVGTLKSGLEARRTRSLNDLDVIYLLPRRLCLARAERRESRQRPRPRCRRRADRWTQAPARLGAVQW